MAASRGLTPAELRAALQLSHALHVATDAGGRKQKLLAGLAELVGARSAVGMVAHVEPLRQRHTIVSVTHHGIDRLPENRLLRRCLAAADATSCRLGSASLIASIWHPIGSPTIKSGGRRFQHCLWSKAPLSEARVVACLMFARDQKAGLPFSSTERLLVHLIHSELSWIYQSDLLLAGNGAESLSPRQRETLRFLLAGKSEKEIAKRMQLSRNTVHHHVKAIHRHFRVSSRSELLARWVR